MPDKVKKTAIEVALKADKVIDLMQERIALLEWETGLLRKTLATAADLLERATWKPAAVKRGDVRKRGHVRRIARIFAPAAPPADEET